MNMDGKRIRNIAKILLKLALGGAALGYVIYKIDLHDAARVLSSIRVIPFMGAILFFIGSKLASAYRQYTLLGDLRMGIGLEDNVKLYWKGMFYNFFLPGGISGDGFKVVFLARKYTQSNKSIFLAILYDRIYGVVALLAFLCLFYYFLPVYTQFRPYAWALLPLLITATWLGTVWISPQHATSFLSLITSSVAVQFLQMACCMMLLMALRIDSDYLIYLFIFLVSSVVAVLPLTIGGMGAREITFYFFAGMLHLETGVSVMVSLLFFLISLVSSVPGFFFSLGGIRGNKNERA
jgi:glycosyltransferase 2 family protein